MITKEQITINRLLKYQVSVHFLHLFFCYLFSFLFLVLPFCLVVGGYPIVDDPHKYPVKLPSIPNRSSSSTLPSSSMPSIANTGGSQSYHTISQPLHPSMTISGNPLPSSSSSSSLSTGGNYGSPRTTSLPRSSSSSSLGSNPTAQQLLQQTNSYQQQLAQQQQGGGVGGDSGSLTDSKWLPVEDDILICMQNAINDPNFSHTMHWLNNAKGIVLKTSRTVQQAKNRYAYLCASGKKDERLLDANVIRTIAKLKKSIKRPSVPENSTEESVASASSVTEGNDNASQNSSSSSSNPPPAPTIGMLHTIEKRNPDTV
jgi:hypothetical protein